MRCSIFQANGFQKLALIEVVQDFERGRLVIEFAQIDQAASDPRLRGIAAQGFRRGLSGPGPGVSGPRRSP